MADETRTPQTEPAEGSRKVIEHELERQNGKPQSGPAGSPPKSLPAGDATDGSNKPESRH